MIELDHIGAAAFIIMVRDDGDFAFERVNAATERLTGIAQAAFTGRTPAELLAPDVAAQLVDSYRACVARREPVEYERVVALPRGTIMTRTTLTPLCRGADEPVTRLLGVSVETTEEYRLREDLKRSNARLAIALDVLGGAHWYFDAACETFELSAAFDRILGPRPQRTLNLDEWLGHVHPDDRDDTCFADILAGRSEQGEAEFRVIANNGDVRWLRCRRRAISDGGVLRGIAGIVLDITQEKRREAALSHQAASDPLTGLANRRRFEEVLGRERDSAARRGAPLSLMMIDVDHFKSYNDTYGHIAGDAVLRLLAKTLERVLAAAGGLAARYGGEEFVAVLPDRDTAAAAEVATAILAALEQLSEPHAGSPTGRLSVSIGVAGHPSLHGAAGHDLVALADAALYRAKSDGRDCYRVLVAPHLRLLGGTAASSAA